MTTSSYPSIDALLRERAQVERLLARGARIFVEDGPHGAHEARTARPRGRPPKVVDEAVLRTLWRQGATRDAMAEAVGASVPTVVRRLRALGLRGRAPKPLRNGPDF